MEVAATRDDGEVAMILFQIEAFWGDQSTTIVRYIEAPDIRTAMDLVPEETVILRINTLGGLYRTARQITPAQSAATPHD